MKTKLKSVTLMYYDSNVICAFRSRAAADRMAKILVVKDNYQVSKFYFQEMQLL